MLKKIFRKIPVTTTPVKSPQDLSVNERRKIALEIGRQKRKEQLQETGAVDKRKNPREAWELEKTSMRKCINANCFDCIGEENYVNRIRYCSIFTCPFWLLRPYSKGITQQQCTDWKEEE